MNWSVISAIVRKDLTAVRRSKAVMLPMLLVPTVMLVVLPLVLALVASRAGSDGIQRFLDPHYRSSIPVDNSNNSQVSGVCDGA